MREREMKGTITIIPSQFDNRSGKLTKRVMTRFLKKKSIIVLDIDRCADQPLSKNISKIICVRKSVGVLKLFTI